MASAMISDQPPKKYRILLLALSLSLLATGIIYNLAFNRDFHNKILLLFPLLAVYGLVFIFYTYSYQRTILYPDRIEKTGFKKIIIWLAEIERMDFIDETLIVRSNDTIIRVGSNSEQRINLIRELIKRARQYHPDVSISGINNIDELFHGRQTRRDL